MKKLFLALVLAVIGFTAFSEELSISVGTKYDKTQIPTGLILRELVITEICPVSSEVCKIVYSNKNSPSFTVYVKKGDTLTQVYQLGRDHFYKQKMLIKSFSYNELKTESSKEEMNMGDFNAF